MLKSEGALHFLRKSLGVKKKVRTFAPQKRKDLI
jgi:hypothetical protein